MDQVLDRLRVVGPIHLIGNSFGALVAAEFAARYPARTARVVLVAPPPVDPANQGITICTMLRMVSEDGSLRYASVEQIRPITPLATEARVALANLVMQAARVFYPVLASMVNYDYRTRLPLIQARTLLVWGGADGLVPLASSVEWRRLLQCPWEEHVFDSAGHCPQADEPLRFNPRIKRFLLPR
jgi:pimeloyl-ACP methyl ester carboxylesterase